MARLEALAASLAAEFAGRGSCVRAAAPLELRGPFHDSSYYLRNVTAGIFGGDSYAVNITARTGTTVRLSGSSATKVYAGNGCESSLRVRLAADAGAVLLWGPHATIVQAGARYRQITRVELAEGGRVALGEVLALGRLAHGEQFAFAGFESGLEVALNGTPAYSESYALTPGRDLVASMAGRGVLASVYLLGLDSPDLEAGLSRVLDNEPLASWSRLPHNAGFVVKALCESLSRGQSLVERVMRVSDG